MRNKDLQVPVCDAMSREPVRETTERLDLVGMSCNLALSVKMILSPLSEQLFTKTSHWKQNDQPWEESLDSSSLQV